MSIEFTMPKLGLTMTDGTIREWLVPEGTFVEAGDPVLIIETDKVETEVEARESGVLSVTGVVGENYECGAVIGYLNAETAAAAPAPATAPASAPAAETPQAPAAAAAADVAARGEGDRVLASPRARATARDLGVELASIAGTGPDGRIVADDVVAFAEAATSAGASVVPSEAVPGTTPLASAAPADVAARGEHDRVLASPRARAAARDLDIVLESVVGTGPGGRIVADDIALAYEDRLVREAEATKAAEVAAAAAAQAPAPTAPVAAAPAPSSRPVASPAPSPADPAPALPATAGVSATAGARMLAELLGLDLRAIPAPTSGARLTREDVAAWVRQQLNASEASAVAPQAETPKPTLAPLLQEPTSVIPLRGMRGVIAERMHASLTEMAQLTLSIDADMTAISAERDRRRQSEMLVPGYTAWVVAAASRALVDHPYVNSQISDEGVATLPDIHVGVAVALDEGLIVPVIRNANDRDVDELHTAVADMAGRARDSKLKLDELEGGTFSVTALGMYGVDMFTPVINPPNSAILGVGRLRTETRWADGVPSPKTVMTLSLTWDHRAFDGAPAAEFAQTIVRYLENPTQIAE